MVRRSDVFGYLAYLLGDLLSVGGESDQKPKPVEWIDATKQQLSGQFDAAMRVAGNDAALAQKTDAAKRLGFEFADMLAERTPQPAADYRKAFSELSELEYEFRYLDDPTPIILRGPRCTLADDDDAGSKQAEADGERAKPEAIEAEFVFRPDGDGYFIKGFGESGNFSAGRARGLHDLFRLVQTPGVPVPMLQLDAGPGVERAEGDARSIQPVVDSLGLRNVADEMKRLKADIDSIDPTSPDSNMERAELEKKLAELTAEVAKVRGKDGKIRDLNASDLNRMKAKIWGRIDTVCNQIKPRFPKLSQHFRDTTGAVDGAFYGYTRGIPDLKWDTVPKTVGREPTN